MYSPEQRRILDELEDRPFCAPDIRREVGKESILSLSTQIQVEITQLDDEMSILQARMEQVRVLKEMRSSQHELLIRTVQSPVFKLPDEILLHIFREVHCPMDIILPFQEEDQILTLTWICRRWRTVLIREPLFWTNLSVSISRKRNNQLLLAVDEIMRRSEGCPLKIKIMSALSKNLDNKKIWHVVAKLFSQAHRISSLSLSLQPEFFDQRFFEALPDKIETVFPRATQLELSIYPPHFTPDTATFFKGLFGDQMPNLTHINFHHVSSTQRISSIEPKWPRFTSIDLRGSLLPFHEVHTLLNGCLQLISLQVLIYLPHRLSNHLDEISPFTPRIGLPSLEMLVISIDEDNSYRAPMVLSSFIVILSLPSVTHLDIRVRDTRFYHRLPCFDILSKYICTLKTLEHLALRSLDAIDLGALITNLPQLHTLVAPRILLPRSRINDLASRTRNSNLPNLICAVKDADLDEFLSLVRSHWVDLRASGRSTAELVMRILVERGSLGAMGGGYHERAELLAEIEKTGGVVIIRDE